MPHTLRHDEGVAAHGDGNVMMPTGETPAFEVVEPELALHLLIDLLGVGLIHSRGRFGYVAVTASGACDVAPVSFRREPRAA